MRKSLVRLILAALLVVALFGVLGGSSAHAVTCAGNQTGLACVFTPQNDGVAGVGVFSYPTGVSAGVLAYCDYKGDLILAYVGEPLVPYDEFQVTNPPACPL